MERKNIFLISGFALALLLIVFNLSLISSAYAVGNLSNDIVVKYAPGASLSGWINMSFTDEPYDSLLRIGSRTISLQDLLSKNSFVSGINYNCSSKNCSLTYSASGSSSVSKNFILASSDSSVIALKLLDPSKLSDISIEDLLINISSNAQESCSGQLKIDIFDDGVYDWVADKKAAGYCGKASSCFSAAEGSTKINLNEPYCQTVFVNPTPGLRVSANVTSDFVGGSANFTFSIPETDQICSKLISGSGNVACTINMSIIEPQNITVCLMEDSGSDYKIYYEDNDPKCGYVGNYVHDFSIFVERQKYGSIGEIIFNSSELSNIDLLSTIMDNYDDCTSGCYIPIRFYSGIANQQISVNSAKLIYNSEGITKTSPYLYSLVQVPSKISMSMQKLGLDNAGFTAPLSTGSSNLSFYFKNSLMFSKRIEVLGVPVIHSISTTQVPAAVKTRFIVGFSGTNISGYSWDFGDNSTIETTNPFASHKYSQMGTYTLTVKIRNIEGESSKSFIIGVVSPDLALNSTLASFDTKLSKLNAQINVLPAVARDYLKKNLKLEEAGLQIQKAKTKLEYSGGEDNLSTIDILNSLADFNLPDSILVTEKASGKFILDKTKVSQATIASVTGETSDANEESFKNAVYGWNMNNLETTVSLQSYSAVYDEILTILGSYASVKLSPKASVEDVYVVINKPLSSLQFLANGAKESGIVSSVVEDLSGGEKTLEFMSSDKLTFNDLPIYFSPLISKLQTDFEISPCNFNKVCEKDLGETWKNCRTDCKPWTLTYLWLFILIIVAFVAYIFAQEWYKRKYEDYLFKDKNDLFNLIHFIDNAEKQGLRQETIFEKLKDKKWASEQLQYAYKKFKGQRTGMWEIPIMKFLENRKVTQQLALRNRIGMSGNIPPTPVRPFIRPIMPNGMPTKPMQVVFGNSSGAPNNLPPVQKTTQMPVQQKPEDNKSEANKQ